MYTLINIIIHFNSISLPQINVISNFNDLNACEKKFDAIKERINSDTIKASLIIDLEEEQYLEVLDSERKLKSYWLCKEILFYK